MQRVQRGDRTAYRTLFQRYQGPIWSFLVRRVGDEEAAADLFQEVFLRVWRSAQTYQTKQQLRPWLYGIAANAARDRYRKSTREVETAPLEGDFPLPVLPDPVSRVAIERAIGQLPNSLREAFLLGVVQGLDHREIALALSISPDNARARVSRARAKLRHLLREGGTSR